MFIKFTSTLCLNLQLSLIHRIYVVHDEVKDKNFELELSWIGEGIINGLLLIWVILTVVGELAPTS